MAGSLIGSSSLTTNRLTIALPDSSITPQPSQLAAPFSCWIEGGVLYAIRVGTTAILNQVYCIPIGADWDTSPPQVLALCFRESPPPTQTDTFKLSSSAVSVLGGAALRTGMGPEPYRACTSGIVDNSGSWTPVGDSGDISGVAGATHIQFRIEFRVSNTMIPARILGAGVTYEAVSTDSHFMVSDKSDPAAKKFVWWFASAFGGTVPTLKVRIYDAVVKYLLVSSTLWYAAGAGEITDGTTWGAYNTVDRANDTTYLRYTPASIADGVVVQPVLSVA